jgi:uncharacterized protein involved in exopolysaccharide biosynthesis
VSRPPVAGPPKDPDDFELIDFAQVKNWVRFVLHSLVRRKLLASAVALLTFSLVAGALVSIPKTYRIEAQLLAQRNSVMAALGNPTRAIPAEADRPTRGAAEAILRRDNLVSLIRQTDLLKRWAETRTWALRTKDRMMNALAPQGEEERVNSMVGYLERQLSVGIAEPTVTISLDWPDAKVGYQIVDTAVQNFLEERHAAEISTIAETITILEGHAKNLREVIDSSIDDLQRVRDQGSAALSPNIPILRRDPVAVAMKAETAEVKVRLDAKRRAIGELDEFRRRRLAELQAELVQQRGVYADAHPTIIKLMQSISALEEDSPQILSLREDERDLAHEYERLSARRPDSALPAPSTPRTPETSVRRRAGDGEDLRTEYARTRLRFAMEKYDVLMGRIDSARIELDTARAAFKYRYSVIRPPTLPRNAIKPKAPVILLGGLLAALGLATFVAALADIRSGRVLEEWQVQRGLGLDVLGSVPRVEA